ncbi:MAG: lipopolysaccharide heptosyltransferase II [Candidatus Omnitrophota bacterium]|nr:MAG: lipopolysaccharide heptosyltransferase II [Candidatus Omnitrophota bacterium]
MQKILVVNPFGIGDVLFTTPVLRSLKQKYPQSFIAYLCNSRSALVLKNNPFVDQIFFYSRGDFKIIKKKSNFKYLVQVFKAIIVLKKMKFDFVIDLSLVTQYSFIFWLIGIKKRYGFNYRNRGFFLTDKIDLSGFTDKHVVEYYRQLMFKAGIDKFRKHLDFFLNTEDLAWQQEFLQKNQINNNGLIVGIAPFGGISWGQNAENKQWPLERFAGVINRVIDKYNARVIIFGVKADLKAAKDLQNMIKTGKIISAVGCTDLRQLGALIKCLNLLISNDSGPMHIACALDIKIAAVYGPVDEKVYGPIGNPDNYAVITKDLACRPCYKNFRTKDCRTKKCLMQISEDNVFDAIERLL